MSVRFNGTSDYWLLSGVLASAAPLSVFCFFRPDATTAGQVLWAQSNAAGGNAFLLEIQTGPVVRARARSASNNATADSASAPVAGQWNSGIAVFRGSTSRFAGHNGVFGTENTTSRVPGAMVETAIGCIPATTRSGFFGGCIRRLTVWKAALEPFEYALLHAGYPPWLIRPSSILSYQSMETLDTTDNIGVAWTPIGTSFDASEPMILPLPTVLRPYLFAAGGGLISGVLAATLADATLAGTGVLPITGAASVTLAGATLAATGALSLVGSLSSTLADVTLEASGTSQVTTSGALAVTLGDVSLNATGALALSGVLATALAGVSLSATGALAIAANASLTIQDATVVATGVLAVKGLLSITLADATLVATGHFVGVIDLSELRTLYISGEVRLLEIAAENRILEISIEDRAL